MLLFTTIKNAYYDLVPAITSQNFQLKFNKCDYIFIQEQSAIIVL
jgi:hypothetical protein